jgi:hypothetical protein
MRCGVATTWYGPDGKPTCYLCLRRLGLYGDHRGFRPIGSPSRGCEAEFVE